VEDHTEAHVVLACQRDRAARELVQRLQRRVPTQAPAHPARTPLPLQSSLSRHSVTPSEAEPRGSLSSVGGYYVNDQPCPSSCAPSPGSRGVVPNPYVDEIAPTETPEIGSGPRSPSHPPPPGVRREATCAQASATPLPKKWLTKPPTTPKERRHPPPQRRPRDHPPPRSRSPDRRQLLPIPKRMALKEDKSAKPPIPLPVQWSPMQSIKVHPAWADLDDSDADMEAPATPLPKPPCTWAPAAPLPKALATPLPKKRPAPPPPPQTSKKRPKSPDHSPRWPRRPDYPPPMMRPRSPDSPPPMKQPRSPDHPPPRSKLKSLKFFSVKEINFSQNSIGRNFKDGRSFDDLLRKLRKGTVDPTHAGFLKLEVYFYDRRLYTLNNRRLWCLKEYQKERPKRTVWVRVSVVPLPEFMDKILSCISDSKTRMTSVFAKVLFAHTSKNDGRTVQVRGDTVASTAGQAEIKQKRPKRSLGGGHEDQRLAKKRRHAKPRRASSAPETASQRRKRRRRQARWSWAAATPAKTRSSM